jgi:septation ring formation regulator EzrA
MVLQTALHAADIDYRVCVVRDGCFPSYEIEDFGEKAVMEKVLKRRTDVMTMEELKQDMVTRAIEDRVIDEVQHQNAHGETQGRYQTRRHEPGSWRISVDGSLSTVTRILDEVFDATG